jgi:lipopolysaccharide exporter
MAKKYSYWLSSGKYSMLQKMTVLVFGILTFMILARSWAFQQHLLGVWGLFLIISSIVETSRNALIRNGYILFIHSKEPDKHPGVEYAAILTNVLLTLLFIIFFLSTAQLFERAFNAPGLATVLYYYSIALLILIPFSFIEIFLIARSDFRGMFWMYLTRNGFLLASVAYLYFSGQQVSLAMMAVIYAVCAFLGLGAGVLMCRKYEKIKMKRNRDISVQFIAFGKYVFGNNIFSLVFRSTDTFMVSSFISPVASAFYSTSGRITNLVDMPSQVLGEIIFPKAAQIMKTNDQKSLKNIYEKAVAATLTFTIPAVIVIAIFPQQILFLLAGSEYLKAAVILQIMIFYGLFLPFIKQFGNMMDVLGRPWVNFILMAVFAAINIGLNALGIYYLGLTGAAYATLFSYVLLFITTQVMLSRKLNVRLVNIFRQMFLLYPDYVHIIRNSIRNFFGISYEK